MLKYFSFVLVMLIFSLSGYGQRKLEPGYVVMNNNEIVYGSIDIRSNVQNSKICQFQPKDDKILIIYTPDDILSYRTDSKYYLSREVEINSKKQKFFLEFLVDGIVDLFYLKDLINEYYFVEKDQVLVPISNKEVSVMVEGNGFTSNDRSYVKNSNQYKGVLNYLFRDGEGMTNRISHADFQYRSLINLAKDYHNAVCSEYECIDYTRTTNRKVYLQVGSGIINTWMGLKTSADVQTNLRPLIGAQLRFTPLKSNSKWHFLLGLNISGNNFHGYYSNDLYFYAHRDTFDLTAIYYALRIPLNIEYVFTTGKIQPFISMGYTGIVLINTDYAAYGHLNDRNYPEFTHFRKYHHGYTGGVGIKYNLKNTNYLYLKSEFEYSIPSANGNYVFDYLRNKAWLIHIGYAFGI